SPLMTQATPPCAKEVFESARARLVMMATEPCAAALRAKLNPAMPLPRTTKSYRFIAALRDYQSIGSFRKRRPPPEGGGGCLGWREQGCRHRLPRHSRCGPATLCRFAGRAAGACAPEIPPSRRRSEALDGG